jgi:hypothetical protein
MIPPASDRIELMVPGSRAVIGWVRPMALPPEQRADFLDLMLQRASSRRIEPSTQDEATNAVALSEDRLRSLKMVSAVASEIERAELERGLALSKLQEVRADRELREFEWQCLKQLADGEFPLAGVDQVGQSDSGRFPEELLCQAREILLREVCQERREPWIAAQNNAASARSKWLSQWLAKLDTVAQASNESLSANQIGKRGTSLEGTDSHWPDLTDIPPVEKIPVEVLNDPGRCKRLLDLVREWHSASATVAAARCESEFNTALSARVSTSIKSDQGLPSRFEYSTDLATAKVDIAENNRELVSLQIRQMLETPAVGQLAAWELTLIDDESSAVLIQLAQQRVSAMNSPANDGLAQTMSRRDKLIALQKQGQASRAEVAAAERLVRQSKLRSRAITHQQAQAEIEARLMVQMMSLRGSQAVGRHNKPEEGR